ncbi:type II toxin-antitoxin system RelE/ParE family toxin [Candidatus Woesearchaeota archaeon]|nr:type II toxin-antitoxin system RelE/ParE family toxin [Candidatus Woesearchaeota archaeon]
MFSAELKKPALKFLKSIKDKSLVKRLSDKIDELEKNPFPQDIERVEGYKDIKVFRVRVGDYRILYFVDYPSSKVYIEKIDKRNRVY